MTYILSQAAAALSTVILLVYSVMKVKRNVILLCNVAINLLLTAHYALLQNSTGAACSLVTTIMVVAFYDKSRLGKNLRWFVFVFFVLLFILCGVFTWEDGWSAIPVVGNILLTVALRNDNENTIKGLFIVIGILWIILNIHLKSVTNTVGQVLAVSSNILYFLRIRKSRASG